MAQTPFTTIQTLAAAAAAIATNPAGTSTQIASILLHNTNATSETIELNFVPAASGALGTVAATNRVLLVALPANETYEISFKFPFTLGAPNDAIFAKTTTGAKVVATVSGVKNT